MEEFQILTWGMIFRAMGKGPEDSLSDSELEKLDQYHREIIADILLIAPKELEAYLSLNTCRSYEQLAAVIAKREQKKFSKQEYNTLLGKLRTRAHRGRKKLVKRIGQIYRREEKGARDISHDQPSPA